MARRSITLVNPIDDRGQWTPPRGYHGHFLPQEEWDPEDLRAFADYIERQKGKRRRKSKPRRSRPPARREKAQPPARYPTYAEMYGIGEAEPEQVAQALRVLRDVCSGICDEGRGPKRNPIEALAIVNPERSFSERAGDTFIDFVDFIKDNPLVAVVGLTGGTLLLGALFYRFVLHRTVPGLPTMAGGGVVTVQNGMANAPGAAPYQITEEDKVWLARMIYGEVDRTTAGWTRQGTKQGGAAVLWSMLNHYMTVGQKRQLYNTLARFIQAYSQPISAVWADPGSSRCQQNPAACTQQKIAFRQMLRAKPFGNLPSGLQATVNDFIAGRLQNPIGTRTDFRAAYTGSGWASDPLVVAGNVFGTNPNARLA
jgi:hypothetical protein